MQLSKPAIDAGPVERSELIARILACIPAGTVDLWDSTRSAEPHLIPLNIFKYPMFLHMRPWLEDHWPSCTKKVCDQDPKATPG